MALTYGLSNSHKLANCVLCKLESPMDSIETQLLFIRAAQRLQARIEGGLRKYEVGSGRLSLQRFIALDYIARNSGCSRTDLAYAIGVTQAQISSPVESLLEGGFITERIEEFGRTKKFLELSVGGAELLAEARDAVYLACSEVWSPLDTFEVKAMGDLAGKVLGALPLPKRYNAKSYAPPKSRRRKRR